MDEFIQNAQNLIENISKTLDGRIVNIMNSSGFIIASTEKDRIGSFHSGAALAARTKKMVSITEKTLHEFRGAKIGCNVPIMDDEQNVLVVVGMNGNPSEIESAARLMALYVNQVLRSSAFYHRHLAESELRNRLFNLLTSGGQANSSEVQPLCELLHFSLSFPCRVIMVDFPTDPLPSDKKPQPKSLVSFLYDTRVLNRKTDLCTEHKNGVFIVQGGIPEDEAEWLHKLLKNCEHFLNNFYTCRVNAGRRCTTGEELRCSLSDAMVLNFLPTGKLRDIEESECLTRYLLEYTCLTGAKFIDVLLTQLEKQVGEKKMEIMLQSAKEYYRANNSLSLASNKINIHKNTLQYRLHRLWDYLGVNESASFEQQYLTTLCIKCWEKRKELRTGKSLPDIRCFGSIYSCIDCSKE
jgi:carbohydrate diacid regulator